MGRAYYNENNKDAAAVLEALIEDGVIAPGVVDTRSIKDVQPNDLKGFTQCHFFAGGGLWSVAARRAGWPDDRPIWTGSCPCQGESLAGKRLGADDPRHLWPDFHRLIRAERPSVVMGEQVAAAAGTHWLDRVCSDLEDEDYASRAVDIPACAVDGPHQRQRLYWVAVANSFGIGQQVPAPGREPAIISPRGHVDPLRNGFWWADAEWIVCHDGKTRRTKPGLPLLVDGFPGRVGLWSIAGNAVSPILAAEVIAAFIDEYGLPERIAA